MNKETKTSATALDTLGRMMQGTRLEESDETKDGSDITKEMRFEMILNCVTPFVVYKDPKASSGHRICTVEGKWIEFDWNDDGNGAFVTVIATCRIEHYSTMRMIILRKGDGSLEQILPFESKECEEDPTLRDMKVKMELPKLAHIPFKLLVRSKDMWAKEGGNKPCVVCSSMTKKTCNECRLVNYCSLACKKTGRKAHLLICHRITKI